ncbi:MAG: hypothetical protein AAGG11_04095 [Pseudomonadota bacterium]
MTPREELAIVRRWRAYRAEMPVSNKSLAAFYNDEVRQDPKLRHCNVFEVLDSITNARPLGTARS